MREMKYGIVNTVLSFKECSNLHQFVEKQSQEH